MSYLRMKRMPRIGSPEMHLMTRVRSPFKVHLRHQIHDKRVVPCLPLGVSFLSVLGKLGLRHRQFVFIPRATDLRSTIEPTVEPMFVLQSAEDISPVIPHTEVRGSLGSSGLLSADTVIDDIIAHVERGTQFVIGGEGMGYFGIEVIEIIATGRDGVTSGFGGRESGSDRQRQEVIERTAGRDDEGRLCLHRIFGTKPSPFVLFPIDRSFDRQFGGDDAYREVAVIAESVTVFLPHIDDRREPSAVTSGEITLVEGHVLHRVGIKDREEPEHMIDRIERYAVEHDQVLIGSATSYVESGRTFRTGLHTGQQLDRFDDIHLTADSRDAFDLRDRHLNCGHLHRLRRRDRLLAGDHHLLEDIRALQGQFDEGV